MTVHLLPGVARLRSLVGMGHTADPRAELVCDCAEPDLAPIGGVFGGLGHQCAACGRPPRDEVVR